MRNLIFIGQDGISFSTASTILPKWARKLIDLGDAFIGRDGPGDLERAVGAYQQSLEMFTEMGALQEFEERLGICPLSLFNKLLQS